MEQEFVIIGWRPSDKPRRPFRSLLLPCARGASCAMPGGSARHSGDRLDDLAAQFRKLDAKARRRTTCRRRSPAMRVSSSQNWSPQIAFRGWTRDNLVRQGAFKGLRSDKPPAEIDKERPMPKETR